MTTDNISRAAAVEQLEAQYTLVAEERRGIGYGNQGYAFADGRCQALAWAVGAIRALPTAPPTPSEVAEAIEALEFTRWQPTGDLAVWSKTDDGRNHTRVMHAIGLLRGIVATPPTAPGEPTKRAREPLIVDVRPSYYETAKRLFGGETEPAAAPGERGEAVEELLRRAGALLSHEGTEAFHLAKDLATALRESEAAREIIDGRAKAAARLAEQRGMAWSQAMTRAEAAEADRDTLRAQLTEATALAERAEQKAARLTIESDLAWKATRLERRGPLSEAIASIRGELTAVAAGQASAKAAAQDDATLAAVAMRLRTRGAEAAASEVLSMRGECPVPEAPPAVPGDFVEECARATLAAERAAHEETRRQLAQATDELTNVATTLGLPEEAPAAAMCEAIGGMQQRLATLEAVPVAFDDAFVEELAQLCAAAHFPSMPWHMVAGHTWWRKSASDVARRVVQRVAAGLLSDAALEAAANVAEAEGSDHSEIDWQRAGVRAALSVAIGDLGAGQTVDEKHAAKLAEALTWELRIGQHTAAIGDGNSARLVINGRAIDTGLPSERAVLLLHSLCHLAMDHHAEEHSSCHERKST